MRYLFYLLCFLSAYTSYSQNDSVSNNSSVSFESLPAQKLIPVFTADARSHRLQILKDFQSPGFIGSMGGQFPLVNAKAFNKTLQFGVAASVYTTLNRYVGRGRVINVDYFVDFLFDLELNKQWKLRGGFGHTSQHLTDDAIEAGLIAQNYVKDYMQLMVVHTMLKQRLLVYGGTYYFHNFKLTDDNIPYNFSKKMMLQAGFELDALEFGNWTYYVAGDLKLRQEFNFGNTHNIQTGLKLKSRSDKVFRFAYNYLGGYEERGQFYRNMISLNTLGFYFDF